MQSENLKNKLLITHKNDITDPILQGVSQSVRRAQNSEIFNLFHTPHFFLDTLKGLTN